MRENFDSIGWHVEFDSLADMIAYCDTPPAHYRGYRSSQNTERGGWYGSRSWAHARELALNGWPEGEALARRYSARLFNLLASQVEQPRFYYDVEGMDFDAARVVAGEPEPWIQTYHETVPAPGKVIRVVYNYCCSSAIDTSVIMTRGAVAIALVQLLEHAGHSVELIARSDNLVSIHGGRGTGSDVCIATTIKRAGQPLDVAEVAFVLAHPSMLRRVEFNVLEHGKPQFLKSMSVGGGYGYPGETPKELQGDIYVGRMLYPETQWERPEYAERWIVEKLKEQGVEVSK